jgi:cytochrome c5
LRLSLKEWRIIAKPPHFKLFRLNLIGLAGIISLFKYWSFAMSNQESGHSHPNKSQPTVAFIGVVVAFVAVISFFMQPTVEVAPEPAADIAAKAEANIKPVASVEVAAVAGPHVEKSGEEVVKAVCAMCHAAGLMESPKLGDKAQWQPRIAQGYDTLVKHAIEGIRNMPAKGGNPDLSDTEIAAAVALMANDAGATFKAPAAPAPVEAAPAAEAKPAA